ADPADPAIAWDSRGNLVMSCDRRDNDDQRNAAGLAAEDGAPHLIATGAAIPRDTKAGRRIDFEKDAMPKAGLRNVLGHVIEPATRHAKHLRDRLAHEPDIRVRDAGDVAVSRAQSQQWDIVQTNARAGRRDVLGAGVLAAQGGEVTLIERRWLPVTPRPVPFH